MKEKRFYLTNLSRLLQYAFKLLRTFRFDTSLDFANTASAEFCENKKTICIEAETYMQYPTNGAMRLNSQSSATRSLPRSEMACACLWAALALTLTASTDILLSTARPEN